MFFELTCLFIADEHRNGMLDCCTQECH